MVPPPLWIKDTSVPPREGWKFFVPQTKFFVLSNSYLQLPRKIAQHCQANGISPPTEEEITRFICENLTVDCRVGPDPFPNKWTEARAESSEEDPIPHEQWPFWALALEILAKPEDKGIGDIIERTIGPIGGDKFKAWHLKVFKRGCGCSERQNTFNERFPLQK